MKKAIILILVICLMPVFNVYADVPVLRVSSVNGCVGDVVKVSVLISDNPGIAVFVLKLEFDNTMLEPISLVQGSAITDGGIISNIQAESLSKLTYVSAFWAHAVDIASDGELFSVTFKIKDGASGSIPIRLHYEKEDIANQNLEDIDFDIVSGNITVDRKSTRLNSSH